MPRSGRYRWLIVAVLFAATTVNYIDRTMLGLLAPTLGTELGWSENDYGSIRHRLPEPLMRSASSSWAG